MGLLDVDYKFMYLPWHLYFNPDGQIFNLRYLIEKLQDRSVGFRVVLTDYFHHIEAVENGQNIEICVF